jgi:hypothetical protein
MPPPKRPFRRALLPVFALLTLSSCLLVVSTSPTAVHGATIVFVAVDDRGLLVASLTVSVADVNGSWHDEGRTSDDGSFRCAVAQGVERVRAGVVLPHGFVLTGSDQWPRNIDVPPGGSVQIEIRVRASAS